MVKKVNWQKNVVALKKWTIVSFLALMLSRTEFWSHYFVWAGQKSLCHHQNVYTMLIEVEITVLRKQTANEWNHISISEAMKMKKNMSDSYFSSMFSLEHTAWLWVCVCTLLTLHSYNFSELPNETVQNSSMCVCIWKEWNEWRKRRRNGGEKNEMVQKEAQSQWWNGPYIVSEYLCVNLMVCVCV